MQLFDLHYYGIVDAHDPD
jgi:hypothetical protein